MADPKTVQAELKGAENEFRLASARAAAKRENAMPSKAKWTILTYIAAHNNLDNFGKKSLMEILGVGSTAEVVQGALYDGKQGAGRYVMGDPGGVE